MDLSNEFDLADYSDCAPSALVQSPAFRQAVAAKLNEYKAGVLHEFRHESTGFLHFLRLAVNEAEGLAWSTPYAHLLLPVLVEEKIQHARQWACRQGRVIVQTSVLV